jgi:hypothetical protein
MTMHPYAAEELARQNEREQRSSAQTHTPRLDPAAGGQYRVRKAWTGRVIPVQVAHQGQDRLGVLRQG